MKISFQVKYEDDSLGSVEFEKPAGAHPESDMTISTAFLAADKADQEGRTAVAIRRSKCDLWITRKDSAGAILTEIMRRNGE
jgi:hypothetical protein